METKFTKSEWENKPIATGHLIRIKNEKMYVAEINELLNTIIAIQKRYSIKNGNMTGDLFDFCEQAIKKATEQNKMKTFRLVKEKSSNNVFELGLFEENKLIHSFTLVVKEIEESNNSIVYDGEIIEDESD